MFKYEHKFFLLSFKEHWAWSYYLHLDDYICYFNFGHSQVSYFKPFLFEWLYMLFQALLFTYGNEDDNNQQPTYNLNLYVFKLNIWEVNQVPLGEPLNISIISNIYIYE